MSDVGAKIAEAVHQGEFYCTVCEKTVDMNGATGFEDGRERILSHAEGNHD
jgi:hypothetical protein